MTTNRPIEVHDVADYITQNLNPPAYYINDLLPKDGSMLLYGNPKVKKSWLAQYIGFCISNGVDFFSYHTSQARVLIVQFEVGIYPYWYRLKLMGTRFQTQNQWLYEASPGRMYLNDPQNYNLLLSVITPIQPQVIIIDCMAASFSGDENSSASMAEYIMILTNLKNTFGRDTSIILVHHTNKNLLAVSSTDRLRGHSSLAGWADTLMYMAKQPTGIQLQIDARQALSEPPNINIRFDPQRHLWLMQGQEGQE